MSPFALLVGGALLLVGGEVSDTVRVTPDDPLQQVIVEAPEGTTIVLESGTHAGPITVSRTLTLRGREGARIQGQGHGSVVTLEAQDVRLKDFEVTDSGRDLSRDDAGVMVMGAGARITRLRLQGNLHGIYVRGAQDVILRDNEVVGLAALEELPAAEPEADPHHAEAMDHQGQEDHAHPTPPGAQALMGNGIHLWNADGAVVEGNRVHHARDGIYVAHTNQAVFRDNHVGDSRYGIHYMYSDDNLLEGNELERNVAGAALMFSRRLDVRHNRIRDHSGFRAYGLLLQDVDASRIHDNRIRRSRVGIRLQSSNANELRGNRVAANVTGITLGAASRDNRFTRNHMGPNLRNVALTGPTPPAEWSVNGEGNRWSGALPLDLTGDGVSEWPHHEVDVLAERREAFPPVELLVGSVGLRALEWALGRSPIPGSRYITDPHPLARDRAGDPPDA